MKGLVLTYRLLSLKKKTYRLLHMIVLFMTSYDCILIAQFTCNLILNFQYNKAKAILCIND